MFTSVATVKAHVSRALAKLGLDNRVQIALLAYDAGSSTRGRTAPGAGEAGPADTCRAPRPPV